MLSVDQLYPYVSLKYSDISEVSKTGPGRDWSIKLAGF